MDMDEKLRKIVEDKCKELANKKPKSRWKRFYDFSLGILLEGCVLLGLLLVVVWLLVKVIQVASSIK